MVVITAVLQLPRRDSPKALVAAGLFAPAHTRFGFWAMLRARWVTKSLAG